MEKQYDEFIKLIHAFKRTTSKAKSNSLAPAEFMTLIAIQHIGMSKQKKGMDEGVKVSEISEQLETSKPDETKENIYVYPVRFYRDVNGNIYRDYRQRK